MCWQKVGIPKPHWCTVDGYCSTFPMALRLHEHTRGTHIWKPKPCPNGHLEGKNSDTERKYYSHMERDHDPRYPVDCAFPRMWPYQAIDHPQSLHRSSEQETFSGDQGSRVVSARRSHNGAFSFDNIVIVWIPS